MEKERRTRVKREQEKRKEKDVEPFAMATEKGGGKMLEEWGKKKKGDEKGEKVLSIGCRRR